MYAVIKTGGKQQRVKAGDVIEVERIVHEGETISFQPLLVVDDEGATHVGKGAASAVVKAKPLGEKKGDKIKVLRHRPKTGYSKRTGHRQLLTLLEIEGIELGGAARRPAPKKAEKPDAKAAPAKATPEAKTTAKPAAKPKPTPAKPEEGG
jgi:large subunit ribosomal protein L21